MSDYSRRQVLKLASAVGAVPLTGETGGAATTVTPFDHHAIDCKLTVADLAGNKTCAVYHRDKLYQSCEHELLPALKATWDTVKMELAVPMPFDESQVAIVKTKKGNVADVKPDWVCIAVVAAKGSHRHSIRRAVLILPAWNDLAHDHKADLAMIQGKDDVEIRMPHPCCVECDGELFCAPRKICIICNGTQLCCQD